MLIYIIGERKEEENSHIQNVEKNQNRIVVLPHVEGMPQPTQIATVAFLYAKMRLVKNRKEKRGSVKELSEELQGFS